MTVILSLLVCILILPHNMDAAVTRPNVVIIVADDLGWNDVGYHGGHIKTPNLDRLAEEGLELNRFYVCPVCSPTRAGLMTGRYPIRFGLQRAVIPPWRDYGLSTDEETLADLLRDAGYIHRGIIGKWHLGHSKLRYHPLLRGFTWFYGHYNGAIDYFTHAREEELDFHRQFEPCYDQGYSTDLLAAEAVRFIERYAGETPFFLYVPFNAPHSPLQAKEEDLERYAHLANPDSMSQTNSAGSRNARRNSRQIYAAMVHSLDTGVGRILETLERLGLTSNTIVWFTSDNGGARQFGASNTPLREGKATVFEGGIRVPASVRWPSGLNGGRRIDTPLAYIDILPTILSLTQSKRTPQKPLDGMDMTRILSGETVKLERDLYSYIAQNSETGEQLAVTTPEWKLIYRGPSLLDYGPDSKAQIELFRIEEDALEVRNLAGENPSVVRMLMMKLTQFRALQPPDGIPAYDVRDEKFKAPAEWRIAQW